MVVASSRRFLHGEAQCSGKGYAWETRHCNKTQTIFLLHEFLQWEEAEALQKQKKKMDEFDGLSEIINKECCWIN